eukprot:GHVP01025789.1.p1 GENE.GHVP01025789.1~~GHVP01025789.1.p1  ORF type:complete len:279 (-),score=37.49 GHVP01025789.1:71-907(-)
MTLPHEIEALAAILLLHEMPPEEITEVLGDRKHNRHSKPKSRISLWSISICCTITVGAFIVYQIYKSKKSKQTAKIKEDKNDETPSPFCKKETNDANKATPGNAQPTGNEFSGQETPNQNQTGTQPDNKLLVEEMQKNILKDKYFEGLIKLFDSYVKGTEGSFNYRKEQKSPVPKCNLRAQTTALEFRCKSRSKGSLIYFNGIFVFKDSSCRGRLYRFGDTYVCFQDKDGISIVLTPKMKILDESGTNTELQEVLRLRIFDNLRRKVVSYMDKYKKLV